MLLVGLDALHDDGGRQPDNTVMRKYTWGLDLAGLHGQVNSLEAAGGIGGLLAVWDSSDTLGDTTDDLTYVYFYDANGDVSQVVDVEDLADWQSLGLTGPADWHASRLAARYEYDPYGNVIGPDADGNGTFDPTADEPGPYAEANPIRFSTKPWDDETGLGYWGYRYYSARLGRWLSKDPIGELGAMMVRRAARGGFVPRDPLPEQPHPYVYVRNTPPHLAEPLGLCPRDDQLTDWKVCCSEVDKQRYGPSAGLVTHCDLRQGACAGDETGFNVWLDGSCDRTMDNGMPCCCASLDDARECLKRNPYSPKPLGPDAGGAKCGGGEWGNNCQTSTIIQLGKCCLRSNWHPSV